MKNLDLSKPLQEGGVLTRPFLVLADVKPQDPSPDDDVITPRAAPYSFEHVMSLIIPAQLEHRLRGL